MERETTLVPVNANVRNGWLSGQTTQQVLQPGQPLCVLIERCFDPALEPFLVAQVNGNFMVDWKDYIPAPDDHILVYVMPQGNRNGKSGFMLIASIAAAAIAPGATEALAGTFLGEVGASIVYAVGTSVVMAALSRSLLKPPNQSVSNESAINPFYSISNASNSFQPFGSVPNIYGQVRFTPAMVVAPDILHEDDGIYLVCLFDFGYGHLEITDIRIGETDISQHAAWPKVHQGFTKDTPLEWFSRVNRPLDAGNALIDTNGVVRTTELATNSVAIELTFPYGLYAVDAITGEREETEVSYEIQARVNGETDWKSIHDYAVVYPPENIDAPSYDKRAVWLAPAYFPWSWSVVRTQIWNNGKTGDDKITYSGFQAGTTKMDLFRGFYPSATEGYIVDPRGLMPNTWPWPHFSVAQNGVHTVWAITLDTPLAETVVFNQWKGAYPAVGSEADENVPWHGMLFNFNQFAPFLGQGISKIRTVSYWEGMPYYNWAKDPINPPKSTDTRQPFIMEWRFNFFFPNKYDIRIVNDANPSPATDYYLNNEIRWTRYTSYSGEVLDTFNPEVPHTVLELKVKATDQVNKTLATVSALASRYLDVYSWKDDQWHFWLTRSPAWAYYDVLTGAANREPVPDYLIDLEALQDWDEECGNTMLVDGYDVPTYCCDMIIQGESTVKEVLDAIAATGRAIPARRDMKHSIIRRQPVDAIPVQLFTQKNVSGMTTTIDYIDPPHAIKIAFMDEILDYKPNEVIIYDDDYDPKKLGDQAAIATKFEEMELPGVTRRQQAWNLGRYYFASILLERERISLTISMEHLIAQRGDLIHLTSDYMEAGGLPRRIVKVQGDHFWVDEPTQAITIIRFRGSSTLVGVTAVDDQEFIIETGYAQYLVVGDLVEWGVTHEIKAPYIIEDIQPGADYSATVRLIEFRPEVDEAILGDIPEREIRPGAVDNYVISHVRDLKLNVYVNLDNSGLIGRRYYHRDLTWMPPESGKVDRYNIFEVFERHFKWIDSTTENFYELKRVLVSDIRSTIEMRYAIEPVVDLRGKGPMSEVIGVLLPDLTPPADVRDLDLNLQTETLTLFWRKFTDAELLDVSHFEIRYSSNYFATWDQASKLVEQVPRDLTAISVPMRVGAYFIKAVDFSYNYSVNAAYDATQVFDSSITENNSVIEFAPFATGSYWNTYHNGWLRIVDGKTVGEYYPPDANALHFSQPVRIRLTAAVELDGIATDVALDSGWFDTLENAVPLAGPSQQVLDQASAQIYFRYKSYNTPGVDYQPWEILTMADVTATDVEFKIVMNSPNSAVTASLTSATVTTDWVQRFESASVESLIAGANVITFQNEFATTPTVNVTILNGNAGDWVQIGAVSNKSFIARMFAANGNAIAGHISWTAKGYGKLF